MPIYHFLFGKTRLPVYCLVTYESQYDLKVLMIVMTLQPKENNLRTGYRFNHLGIIGTNYWLRQVQIVELREQDSFIVQKLRA